MTKGDDDYWWDDPIRPVLVVDEPTPKWSGLYNHRGEKLERRPPPFGFRRARYR